MTPFFLAPRLVVSQSRIFQRMAVARNLPYGVSPHHALATATWAFDDRPFYPVEVAFCDYPCIPLNSICNNEKMCGRYRLSRRRQVVEEYFEVSSDIEDWNPGTTLRLHSPCRLSASNPRNRGGTFPSFAGD
jgi:hypothetical protein